MLDISFSTCFLSRHLDWFTQSQTVFSFLLLLLSQPSSHRQTHVCSHITHILTADLVYLDEQACERGLEATVCICMCVFVFVCVLFKYSEFQWVFLFFLLLRILANQSGSLRENWGDRECKRELQESEAVEILYIGHKAEALTWEDAVWENFRKWWTLVIF